ncbi:peptidoglycan editing factor PgeF [Altererythrobacter indicus]|uniref:Purine nucleoside phosphorylase n=1 Tax=Altericroceibacterium indicum TaxID=374177 RepID=A0A845A9U0_9SPHN|nr:peptidoglycan editing factor PgeF [Altericroceibacterium indicum]MXP27162.1 peptidoglycan editing factor PgeF [Altericroceibacterium indicum]
MVEPVEIFRAATLSGVPHGFFGRRGGASKGVVAGLNVGIGSDDDPATVCENRGRAVEAVLPGADLATVYQVHSARAVIAERGWSLDKRPRADALVTDQPGVVLGIVTADCAPVLFADHQAGIVAAAHAGWRGAHGGVLETTIDLMEMLGAVRGRICAAVGPAIAQDSYEVDDGFKAQFNASDDVFFRPGAAGHWQFNLEGYVMARLQAAAIGSVTGLAMDTYTNPDRFFSYRRATHKAEPTYGRQFSLIGVQG